MKIIQIQIIAFLLILSSLANAQEISTKDSLEAILQQSDNTERVNILMQLAMEQETADEAEKYLIKAVDVSSQIEDLTVKQEALNQLIQFYYSTVNFDKAEQRLFEQEEVCRALGDSIEMSMVYTRIGVLRKNSGDYDQAVVYYQKALELQEKMSDLENAGYTLLNIANVYFSFLPGDDFAQALKYYNLALNNFEEIDNITGIALCKLNLGLVNSEIVHKYSDKINKEEAQKKLEMALKYTLEAKATFEELRDYRNFVQALNQVGQLYIAMKEYNKAEKELLLLAEILNESADYTTSVKAYISLGALYKNWKKYDQSLQHYSRGLEIAMEANLKNEASDINKKMSEVYEMKNEPAKALESFRQYSNMRDSIFNAETSKQINEIQTKYETEKKQKEIELLTKEQEKQQLITNALIVGTLLLVVLAFLVYNRYRLKKKANEKLAAQNDEISEQRDKIMEQKQEITDSIQYASRIQSALLPPTELVEQSFREHFIFFKPRDIVSGDFYWMTAVRDRVYIAAADCTGHGVPGAFMSMLGISFLNEIVSKNVVKTADVILNQLRENVISSLRQTGKANEAKDGMDISLAVIDYNEMTLQFAGAYNPLYLIRNQELLTYKADKMPIGIYFKNHKPFTNHEIKIEKDDCIYLFSDGYIDQFGEVSGRKFMSKRFKELLTDIHHLPMQDQKMQLDLNMIKWQGTTPQLDDMIIIGIRF